jgi:hypothetical protein
MSKESHQIRVKIINRGQPGTLWASQTPGKTGTWKHCQFIFDRDEAYYDWLVVIDDVSRGYVSQPETLNCADEHTLLVTTEPSTITRYGESFAAQFEYVLTSQDDQALPHPRRIHSHTGNLWFNGRSYDEIVENGIPTKSAPLSTVCSSKKQKHTIHRDRYDFTSWLKQKLPEMDIFGHGIRYVEKKYVALEAYRYHLAIENYIGPHHWTEKLADPYLSGAVPIYCGCTNIEEYFPKDSYITIDINNREAAFETIKSYILDPMDYAKRLEALREAQNLVLNKYNLLAMLDQIIPQHFSPNRKPTGRLLCNRKQMRFSHPRELISHLYWGTKRHFKPKKLSVTYQKK